MKDQNDDAQPAPLAAAPQPAEPYTPPHSQFRYGAQPGRAQHTFAEYRAKARQRGGEVMRAVAEEFPEATIFSYRLFSDRLPMLVFMAVATAQWVAGDRCEFDDVVMSEIRDHNPRRALSGLLAVQAHTGPPMKAQFKNIRLREFKP